MVNTLVIYEGKYGTASKVAHNMGYIIGNTKVLAIEEAPKEMGVFQNVVVVFSFRGYDTLSKTKVYLEKVEEQLKGKQMAAVGVGLSKKDLEVYMKTINKIIEVKEAFTYFIQGQLSVKGLDESDYTALEAFTKKVKMPFKDMGQLDLSEVAKIATDLKKKLMVNEKPMEEEKLKIAITEFIKKHNMLALTTGSRDEVRCSPVEYIYNEGYFYIITEGGLKFRGLTQNNKVSFGIYDAYKGSDALGGLQVTATAKLVPLRSEEYMKIMGIRGVGPQVIQKLPIDLYMVKLIPSEFEFLYSPLKKEGYGVKQNLVVNLL